MIYDNGKIIMLFFFFKKNNNNKKTQKHSHQQRLTLSAKHNNFQRMSYNCEMKTHFFHNTSFNLCCNDKLKAMLV